MATYAGRYDEVLLRKAGNRLAPPAANTTVLVYESDGTTVATLYADRTKAMTAANPVTVDASGNLEFFAAPGTYVLAIREDGVQRATDTAVVHLDPGDESEGLVDSVNGKTGAVTLVKGDVGLGNVDNTSDVNKPVSLAQQAALDAKAPLASPALTGTPTVPTAAPGTNTTQAASTAFVGTAVGNATSHAVIAEQTLAASVASITFAAIPSTYRDLRLVLTAISTNAATNDALAMRFNADAGAAQYLSQRLQSNGTTTNALGESGASMPLGLTPGTTAPANQQSMHVIEIPRYAGATYRKVLTVANSMSLGDTTADQVLRLYSGTWKGTAAITQIEVGLGAAPLAAGTRAVLYGIG